MHTLYNGIYSVHIIYFSPIVETRRGRHIVCVCRNGISEVHSHNIRLLYNRHKRLYNALQLAHARATVAVSIKNVLAPHKHCARFSGSAVAARFYNGHYTYYIVLFKSYVHY